MKKHYCQACSFARNGVKSRKPIRHTCGIDGPPPDRKYEHVPTREEFEKYLAKLKELMEQDENGPPAT